MKKHELLVEISTANTWGEGVGIAKLTEGSTCTLTASTFCSNLYKSLTYITTSRTHVEKWIRQENLKRLCVKREMKKGISKAHVTMFVSALRLPTFSSHLSVV
jgi:hypothetical protein